MILATCIVVACANSPLTLTFGAVPHGDTMASRAVDSGCAEFVVAVSAARRRVTVTPIGDAACGGTLRPLIDSVQAPVHDRGATLFRVWILFANHGPSYVTMPARLHAAVATSADSTAPDVSLAVRDYAGRGRIAFVRADSGAPDAPLWRYDGRLASPGRPQALAPGTTSLAREIDVRVPTTPGTWHLLLEMDAQRGMLVPAVPPDVWPSWFGDDSAHTRQGAVKRIVMVRFQPTATQADRQQVVDLVSATVVGGTRIAGDDGVYYLYFPTDTSDAQLRADAQRVDTMPHVASASANRLMGPKYLGPTDGFGGPRGT